MLRLIPLSVAALLAMVLAAPTFGATTVTVDQAECLPVADNGLITLTVDEDFGGSEVRVYFRRLHQEVEDFYYVIAEPYEPGRYWAVLPKAEDEVLERYDLDRENYPDAPDIDDVDDDDWADWWRAKEGSADRNPTGDLDDELIEERASLGKERGRNWMETLDDATFQRWLEELEYEPTEYFGSVFDPQGNEITRSPMKVVEVQEDCPDQLSDEQRGFAENLTVGETALWSEGEEVFHWLCDGIVNRIDPNGILRADEICRVCFVAWWQKEELLIPAAAATLIGGGVIASDDDDPVTPILP
ncbi:MAG: hypothetical protein AAGD01_06570 [Acidobacteriota bacterium]